MNDLDKTDLDNTTAPLPAEGALHIRDCTSHITARVIIDAEAQEIFLTPEAVREVQGRARDHLCNFYPEHKPTDEVFDQRLYKLQHMPIAEAQAYLAESLDLKLGYEQVMPVDPPLVNMEGWKVVCLGRNDWTVVRLDRNGRRLK